MGSGRSKGKGKSKLTKQKFRSVNNSVFDGDAEEFVGHLFRSYDSNQDGSVDFKVSGSEKPETKLKWTFNMYDQDGNGSISREEMSNMLKRNPEDEPAFEESVTQLDAIYDSNDTMCTQGQAGLSERAKAYAAS
ncbi:hippocalcin-like protein 1 [Dreissena polymorpha]|uniref:hippocalcin-like protein 1 n=1 Tax=Dreissena polymorpha TaxID=45954 RepID=UPI002264699F|nr:hippocalcin-like protein 1 [Dreissena polymorpha]